ncbi:Glycosyltransferase 2 [Gracilaria domingensis]|nr:Glycosyltransferase 2 [Gracilaria domingensis]
MVSHASRAAESSRHPRSTLLILILLLALRGQFYISSTFAGTRPPRASNASHQSEENSWQICDDILRDGLNDIGDASTAWLTHAYVGSNHYPTNDVSQPSERYQCRCLIPQLHVSKQPLLTAIVQSFNHHGNIANISTSLKSSSAVQEIVISEDGSTDGSLHDWHAALSDPRHFIIRSNNLHELRSYNRAMRMSSGDIVVLLQDDDLLPLSDEWLKNAIKLFEALPDLGVLGGYIGQLWDHDTGQGYEYGEQISTHGGLRQGNTKPLQFIEPTTKLPFMYAECVWISPVFIRREVLRKAGGLELTIAKRGEPGVWQDCVFSYEAWINGYTVGTYSAPFQRGVGGHGSATSTMKVKQRERVYERAVAYTNRKYPRRRIHDSITARNNRTLLPRASVK